MEINCFYLIGIAWLSLVAAYCPPTGPVLPPPDISSNSNLTTSLNIALRKLAKSGIWNTTTTSFSVELTSSKENLFSFHHTSPKLNSSGVDKVDSKTIYRVASVTKVFTTLALLLQNEINLDDSITKYVPELSNITWYKDVTLRMLASQRSGVHRDGYTFDLAATYPPNILHDMGFPDVQRPPEIPLCDTLSDPPCNRAEFFKDLENNQYVWQPGQRAAYSDLGFILLGFALENITGISYGDIILQQISKPLNLSSVVGFTLQDVSKSILPIEGGSQWMEREFGNYDATAGLYATPDDLSHFVRGVLSHDLLVGPRTDSWLQPAEFTSSVYSSVGMPWEIYRTTSLTPLPRPVDVYTKSGNVGVYAAYIALIPEYDVGFTINAAGADAYITSRALLDTLTTVTVQNLDQLARSQAQDRYTGRYSGKGDSLVLVVDEGPGIKIQQWICNGDSVLEAWQQLRGGDGRVDARIYPVGRDNRWRVVFQAVADKAKASPFGDACDSWFKVDQFRYQGLPVDEIDFTIEASRVKGLSVPGLRQTLAKSSGLRY